MHTLPKISRSKIKKRIIGKHVPLSLDALKGDQKIAFKKLRKFIQKKDFDFCRLRGSAGTGKTWLTQTLLHWLIQKTNYNIGVIAFTHEAVAVQQSMISYEDSSHKVYYGTAHAGLALKLHVNKITQKEEYVHNPYQTGFVEGCDVVIIDESSMLPTMLLDILLKFKDEKYLIFIGDEKQIPPIENKSKDQQYFSILDRDKSPVYKDSLTKRYDILEVVLLEVLRQAKDSPIITHSMRIYHDGTKVQFIDQYDKKLGGVVNIPRGDFENRLLSKIINTYCKKAVKKQDPYYVKFITYTRKQADHWNELCRKQIYGKNRKQLELNEIIVLRAPTFKFETIHEKQIVFPNNTKLIIEKVHPVKTYSAGTYEWNAHEVEVRDLLGYQKGKLYILTDQEAKRRDILLKELYSKNKLQEFYHLRDSFAWYEYMFATTAHRSQGRTYQTTIVDYKNIKSLSYRNKQEFRKLAYTASTRASFQIFNLV